MARPWTVLAGNLRGTRAVADGPLTVLNVAYPLAPVGPDAVGGAEQTLTRLDEALVRAGHTSVVVAAEGSTTRGVLLPVPTFTGHPDERTQAAAHAADTRQCLLAEDARALYGQFSRFCGPEPRNAGMRGLPPGYPLQDALGRLLREVRSTLVSELDEQGLQVAAVSMLTSPEVVSIDDVSICSPFPPHRADLGRCGAHFCGLNARHFAWQLEGRYAEEWIDDHWQRHLPMLCQRVGIEVPSTA